MAARLAAYILALFVLGAAPAVLWAGGHRGPQDRNQKPHADRAGDRQQPRDRWKWWLYDRAELNITDKQSADIDKIFETAIPGQRARREELERLEDALAVTVKENKADVATVAQQVEKVENLRAELNKTRTVMLYRINLLLTADQRVKLERLRARRDEERRRDPNHRR
jgi:Spy/CpxP family protein refolding chaperone